MMKTVLCVALLSAAAWASPGMDDRVVRMDDKSSPQFPLPKDASAPENAPGGGGKIQVYKVPRGRDIVVAEARKALAAGGWTIINTSGEEHSRAIRLQVKKGDTVIKASFTGDDAQTAIILTLP
jgi:hypothetical protein